MSWCLKGISINVNGLNNPTRHFFQQLYTNYNLIALQETKFHNSDTVRRATFFSNTTDSKAQTFWSHSDSNDFHSPRGRDGVGLLISGTNPFTSVENVTHDHVTGPATTILDNRYLVVQANTPDFPLMIHVIYAPVQTQARRTFFQHLPTEFNEDHRHLILGDFNVPLDPSLDELRPSHSDLGQLDMQNWLSSLGVIDAWRSSFPERREFTGPQRRNRIDYCFMSPLLFGDYLSSIHHLTEERFHHEDHLPIKFDLRSPNQPHRAPLPWKCPRWILEHQLVQPVLKRSLEALCTRLRCGATENPGALVDEHKRSDSIFLRRMATELRNNDSEHRKILQHTLYQAESAHATAPTDESRAKISRARSELKTHDESMTARREQFKFDSDINDGETGSAHFLRSPYSVDMRVSIPSVTQPDGTSTAIPEKMANAHRDYWGNIFQSPSKDMATSTSKRKFQPIELTRLLRYTKSRLSNLNQQYLDAPMTAHDFFYAITKSAKGKSSGLDGLPVEYYQLFPHEWAQVYEMVYASQLAKGRMSKFQRRAYISLLYKKGDRSLPSNYRPITLLNHDAKFGPKIMAYRMKQILPALIGHDQFGFIHGRSIRHALVEFQDIQQYCQHMNLAEAGAVLLDFAKAFDSVLWPALDMVLAHMNFGAHFRHAVRTFYKGTLATVLVNGVASKYFEIGCGVRQGDPLSPALFVVFIEPLLCYLRETTERLGIQVTTSGRPHHVMAFADDCTGLLSSLRHTCQFLEAVQRYSNAAGLTLNAGKTVVLPFQALAPTLRTELTSSNLEVVPDNGRTKLLGVYQSPTLPQHTRFHSLVESMEARCQLWKHRARTIRGRAVILRTIVLPLLWYTAAVTPIPPSIAARVVNLCKRFLFKMDINSTKTARGLMPETWLYWPTSLGGLGLPSPTPFSAALRLTTLRDATQRANATLTAPRWFEPALQLFTGTLQGNGVGFDILYAAIPATRRAESQWMILGEFWFRTLRDWHGLRQTQAQHVQLLSHKTEMPLWHNFLLMVGTGPRQRTMVASSILLRHYRDLGYVRLRDFVSRHGSFPTSDLCRQILSNIDFATPRLQSLAASHFCQTLQALELTDLPLLYGPNIPDELMAATHSWTFNSRRFHAMRNRDFYRALHTLRPPGTMPNTSLDIEPAPNWATVWRIDIKLNKQILPVLSDLLFRLQHNALNVRRKYSYLSADVNCPHGCTAKESAMHLFWNCPIARHVWTAILRPIAHHLAEDIDWPTVVYLSNLRFTNSSITRFGRHNLLRIFHVIRCSTLYPIWIHRNHRIFQGVVSSASTTYHQVRAYCKLHLAHLASDTSNARLTELSKSIASSLSGVNRNSHGEDPHQAVDTFHQVLH